MGIRRGAHIGRHLDHEGHETTRKARKERTPFVAFASFVHFVVQVPGSGMALCVTSDPPVHTRHVITALTEAAADLAELLAPGGQYHA